MGGPVTIEPAARKFFSSYQFWIGIAYFGLVLTFVLAMLSFQKANEQEAEVIAQREARNAERVSSCYQRYAEAPATRRFIVAQIAIAENQRNALQLNIALMPDDPRRYGPKGWIVSLGRIDAAIADLEGFIRRSRTTSPTRAKCDALADSLGVVRQNVRR